MNIKHYFSNLLKKIDDPKISNESHSLELILATLMVEMGRADRQTTDVETEVIRQILDRQFDLSGAEQSALLELAEDEADHATSLFEFTNQLKQLLPHEQRGQIIKALWQVAFADGKIDKYEEQLVRKVADLLHVRHQDFIAAKLDADPAR